MALAELRCFWTHFVTSGRTSAIVLQLLMLIYYNRKYDRFSFNDDIGPTAQIGRAP